MQEWISIHDDLPGLHEKFLFHTRCNERASDGCWGRQTAMYCIGVINVMQSTPFWRCKKKWKEYEQLVVTNFVNPTNEKIREYLEKEDWKDGT